MLTQVDSEGYSLTMMEGIVDHREDESTAVSKADAHVTTKRGQRRRRKTTAGWEIQVKCKDQSESWVRLAEMKKSHPIETAEYAKSRGIDDEPAFAWWVPYTLHNPRVPATARLNINLARLDIDLDRSELRVCGQD
jgi:hypothetical protein